MVEADLLDMLAAETDRRAPVIIEGVENLAGTGEADPKKVEALRVEAHGLKGAAMVVGQTRLSALALGLERVLADSAESGRIDTGTAAKIVAGVSSLEEGARAAAEGVPEPPSVGRSLEQLGI